MLGGDTEDLADRALVLTRSRELRKSQQDDCTHEIAKQCLQQQLQATRHATHGIFSCAQAETRTGKWCISEFCDDL